MSSNSFLSRKLAQPFSRKTRESTWFYIFISPWLLGFVFLWVVPLGIGFLLSLTNFDGMNFNSLTFIGIDNYLRVLRDADAIYALQRTFIFVLVSVPIKILFSFLIAFLLTRRIYFRSVLRTLFYIPSILPIVAVAWIWKLLMDRNIGLVNTLLSGLFPGTAVGWLTDYATLVLVALSVWIGTGGAMVIFIAGIESVPRELEEAAQIDGANFFQMFRLITFPMVTPVIFYQVVISIIFALQVLIEPMLLGSSVTVGGGLSSIPPRDNYMFMVHTYTEIFVNRRFGYGSALLWILFVLVLVLTILVFKTSRFWVYYEVDQEGK